MNGRKAGIFIAILLLVSGPIRSAAETGEERFWIWFKANAKRLYHREQSEDPSALDRELQDEIRKVNPLLIGVLDGIRSDGRRIFIISCGARKEGIPAVRALYRKLPVTNAFRIVTFVPGRIRMRDLEYKGLQASVKDVRFLLFRDETGLQVKALMLFGNYSSERDEDFRQLARLLLVDAIGEWETITKIGTVLAGSSDSPYYREAWPVQSLPTRFNLFWYSLRLPG